MPRPATTIIDRNLLKGFAGNLVGRTLHLLSSVPFGIVLLILLIIACTIDDLYQTKYFNLMLALLGVNVILTTINHFPAACRYILRKKLTASPTFAMAQNFREKIELPILGRKQLVERAAAAARAMRFKIRVTLEETQTTIFAECGAWNRLGAYAIQVGLLTIFASGFWNNYRGYTGKVWIEPGKMSDKMIQGRFNVEDARASHATGQVELQLPFTVEGLDVQQQLIDKNRPFGGGNTLDWITRVRIHDHETGQKTEVVVHMNSPFDYRGHRFLQVASNPLGNAHMLQINYYPGTKLMYVGGTILCLALIGVFLFSHQRLWIVVEDGTLYLGGNANRNRLGFEDRAKKLASQIREPWIAENRT